jgi:two-component system response regulator HydG
MARFLILDDEEDLGVIVQMILELDGHEAEVATDAETVVKMQRKRAADVLITDIFMPDKDGFEVIREFQREFPSVSIIAMSGGGEMLRSPRYLSSAREIGASHSIRKPFEKEALLTVVGEVLESRARSAAK